MDCSTYVAYPLGPQQRFGPSADAFSCKILNKFSFCKDRELITQDGLMYAIENSSQIFRTLNEILQFMKSPK